MNKNNPRYLQNIFSLEQNQDTLYIRYPPFLCYRLSESLSLILCGFQNSIFMNSPTFFNKYLFIFQKTIDKSPKKYSYMIPHVCCLPLKKIARTYRWNISTVWYHTFFCSAKFFWYIVNLSVSNIHYLWIFLFCSYSKLFHKSDFFQFSTFFCKDKFIVQ